MALTDEPLVEIKDSPEQFPHPPSLRTVFRWILEGTGNGVRLESVKIGRRRYTSVPAIRRFIHAQTEADEARRAQASGDGEPSDERPAETLRRLQQKGIQPIGGSRR